MKLYELRELLNSRGTYAGVRFCKQTQQALMDYMHEARIPNMVNQQNLHTTLLYSRVPCPGYVARESVEYIGYPTKLNVWNTPTPDGGVANCLVLSYSCPALEDRHIQLRREHGATHDYSSFNPHITLSYNVGELSTDAFPSILKYVDTIRIISEYKEDLIPD